VIIASSQVSDFLGLGIARVPADFLAKWTAYFDAIGRIDPMTIAFGVGSLLAILLLRRFLPGSPPF
jgi:SulP family sulfate permease